ncbi:MAG: hypothetical protein L0H15_10565 [Nitrosospira sp.]|nr:hypothetical protein [Nitrosospira sp.]
MVDYNRLMGMPVGGFSKRVGRLPPENHDHSREPDFRFALDTTGFFAPEICYRCLQNGDKGL